MQGLIGAARGHVQTACTGVAAVDKCKDQKFDVTLMDIVMPEMNGVEAFKKIREVTKHFPQHIYTEPSCGDSTA
jgi:YesN/AraC family two-component response regulator